MTPQRIAASILLAFILATAPGCQKGDGPRVAEIDPYVGARPAPIRPIAPPPKKVVRPPVARGGEAGWTPAGGFSKRWDCIVIHHSGSDKSSPQSMRHWHMQGRGWDELGYHFVIGNGVNYGDGQVFVGARWNQQKHGAHCKTPDNHYNDHGVGICLIGDLEKHPPTAKQLASLAKLTSFLTGKCNISRNRVLTHGGVTHKTACPGRHFRLASVLSQMNVRTAAADFADDSTMADTPAR